MGSNDRIMRNRNVALPLGILSACAVAETAIGYAHSVDARGWWPIGLAVTLLLYASYSIVFGAIAGDRTLSAAYIAGLNGVLVAVRVLSSYLFYTLPTDWSAVNAGMTQRTFHQSLIHSEWTFFLLPMLFLVAHFVAVRTGWLGVNQQPRGSAR